jgi:LysR family glycine cleavage system transcriptional activator
VSLSINATFMNLWLADRLPRFRSIYPECELDVSIHDDDGKGGNPKADLRLLFVPDDFDDPSLTRLISLIYIPVCAPALVTGPNALRTPADLAKHRLLHEDSEPGWKEWIEGEGVRGVDPESGAIFHDPSLSIREALNGGGVALADNIMVEDLLARGLLVAPFPIRRHYPYCYALSQRRGASAILGIKQFRQWLASEIELHKRTMKLSEL